MARRRSLYAGQSRRWVRSWEGVRRRCKNSH